MKFSIAALVAVLFPYPGTEGSFLRDIVRPTDVKKNIQASLLEKAIPLDEYRAKLNSQGLDFSRAHRKMEDEQEAEKDYGEDDYYINEDYLYSFSGYSLQYAECQPIQRFSEDAIEAGEYTPMVTDDIVILRLCPSSSCSSSSKFGCNYNYVEYAVDISDYIRIMLRHTMDKKEQLCDWCDACAAQRKLEGEDGENQAEGGNEDQDHQDENENQQEDREEEEADNEEQNQQEEGEDQGEEQDDGEVAEEDDGVEDENGDDAAQGNDDDNQAAYDDKYYDEDDECYQYSTYCFDEYGYSVCEDEGDDTYLSSEDYIEYMGCAKVKGYYLRPRCNGYKQTISMGVYYDPFCSEYAGDKVNIGNLGLGIKSDAFEEYYSEIHCLDCSESDYPPSFNANSNMCNRMHLMSATCTKNLQYDMFDSNVNETTTCSFIESIRAGTYDEEGNLYSASSNSGKVNREVTPRQKVFMGVSVAICVFLAMYSCYLHHSITNLLIKSLSHTDLLPPSRSRRRSRSGRRNRRQIVAASEDEDDEDEWENQKSTSTRKNSTRTSRKR